MNEKSKVGSKFSGGAKASSPVGACAKLAGHWKVRAKDPTGKVLWTDTLGHIDVKSGTWVDHNMVVNVGLDDILDKYFNGSGYTAAHYVGLTDGTPTAAAADTMSTHAGWTEVTAYSSSARPAWNGGTVSSQSVDNSTSVASFSINSTGATTIGGAFLGTGNTAGGSTGILYAVGAFTAGDKSLSSGDTLEVTVTLTAST